MLSQQLMNKEWCVRERGEKGAGKLCSSCGSMLYIFDEILGLGEEEILESGREFYRKFWNISWLGNIGDCE